MATKFFLCTTCGNVVVKFVDSGVNLVCCGNEMKELIPATSDGALEKHVPVVERVDDCTIRVKVGSQPHPMMEAHYIEFICLESENGVQVHYLKPGDPAETLFCTCKDKPVAVYEYCNIHGLWKTDIKEEQLKDKSYCCDVKKEKCWLSF